MRTEHRPPGRRVIESGLAQKVGKSADPEGSLPRGRLWCLALQIHWRVRAEKLMAGEYKGADGRGPGRSFRRERAACLRNLEACRYSISVQYFCTRGLHVSVVACNTPSLSVRRGEWELGWYEAQRRKRKGKTCWDQANSGIFWASFDSFRGQEFGTCLQRRAPTFKISDETETWLNRQLDTEHHVSNENGPTAYR